MGNYVLCQNYTQKQKNHFILLMRSHFSLIAKNGVAIGTRSLQKLNAHKVISLSKRHNPMIHEVFFTNDRSGWMYHIPMNWLDVSYSYELLV